MKSNLKAAVHIFASIILLFGAIFPFQDTAEASPSFPNPNNMPYSYIDSSKTYHGSNRINIMNNPEVSSSSSMRLLYSQVQIDGSNSGWVNGYVDTSKSADNGYPYVDTSEISAWTSMMNGNPAFMTEGNGLIGHTIKDNDGGASYKAYLLSRIATMSGGRGIQAQFYVPRVSGDLKAHDNDYYKTVVRFETTPRPTGGIGTGGKTQFNIGDTVSVNFWAEDYSFYDRGIKVINYYIYNVDTQQTEMSFMTQINSEYKASGTALGGPSNPYNIPVSGQKFIPTKAGNYEARVLITDLHDRNSQNASSAGGTGVPYKAPFKVGNVTDPDPEPEPGPGCSVSSSTTKMDIQVNGDKDVKNYTAVSSGGSSISVEKFAEISVYSTKAGKFTMNGVEMNTGSGGNRKVGVGSVGSSGTVKIVFKSDDGKDCWEKTFDVDEGKGSDKCPIVSVGGQNVKNGDTLEVLPSETLRFKATYKDAYGDVGPAEIKWDVVRPNGKVETLPGGYEEVGGRERWGTYNSSTLELPFGKGNDSHDVLFEKGQTYKLRLNYSSAQWEDMPECAWEITIKVKDASCTITEQNRIKFTAYGTVPNPYPPGGQELDSSGISRELYYKYFTDNGTELDTNMGLSASAAGTWYLKYYGKKTALTGKLAANERFDLMLPVEAEPGDEIVLIFESDTGCIRELSFEILSDRKCSGLLMSMEATSGDEKWEKTIQRGEVLEIPASDFDGYRLRMFTSVEAKYLVYWLDPDTQTWQRKRNGDSLSNSSEARNHHYIGFPKDDTTKVALDGFYMVLFYDEDNSTDQCDGHFFVQIGESTPTPDGENLLIIKSSFKITPNSPQSAGTEATITFNVKNAGKLEHNTTLAVRWESSSTATMLDVNAFKPGETRKITIPTKYPQQSEDFIGNINPDKDKPADETIWPDNRAQWPVEVTGSSGGGGGGGGDLPDPPGGGGNYDSGEIGLKIFDSDDRELQLQADGVWEREPAKIRAVIDQTKINEGFDRVESEINQAINQYKAQLESSIDGENVSVTATPAWISDAKTLAVYSPAMLDLKVTGPGTPQQWQVSSTGTGGDYTYTGTIVPTQTTWRDVLNAQKYKAEINGFVITMDYNIQFDVSYETCEENEDGEEVCEPQSDTKNMTGRYTITVKGSQREFDVFEPNFTLTLHKTPEWQNIHAKDEYKNSKANDWYAGEAILTHVNLEPRHKHPVSGKYPVILSATTWMREQGGVAAWMKRAKVKERPYWHQVSLNLVKSSEILWGGPKRDIPDPNHSGKYLLRNREKGVDDGVGRQTKSGKITMGDIWYGLQPGETYGVQGLVSFKFGVNKGFTPFNKGTTLGSQAADYNKQITIIDNALSRILNYTQIK
ncbi:ABC transporter permease [Brevibacillus choshinensis]|uniref:ABC transporter permease n=1 Tax=Brevibacillus choshinensis TaxID=54911 RepID=UPI002E1D4AEE|nr:ABC transporter permease [Brevibacillus choshinensis]